MTDPGREGHIPHTAQRGNQPSRGGGRRSRILMALAGSLVILAFGCLAFGFVTLFIYPTGQLFSAMKAVDVATPILTPPVGAPILPPSRAIITPANAASVRLLAHFGKSPIVALAFGSDSQTLAVASPIGISLYSSYSGILRRLSTSSAVSCLSFAPDGQTLAVGMGDGKVRLLRVTDFTLIRELTGHTDKVTSVAFSPDGQTLVSASDGVFLWGVTP